MGKINMEEMLLGVKKAKIYSNRLELMLNTNIEKLFKFYPDSGDGQFAEGYRGQSEDDHEFMGWLSHDIVNTLEEIANDLQEHVEAGYRRRHHMDAQTEDPIPSPAGILNGEADSPVRISDLISRLLAVSKIHGDLVVLVEGNPLATLSPIIWTGKDHILAGEVLANCLFLEAATEGGASC